MIPATLRYAILLAALAAAWQPSKARAQNEDVQLWQIANISGDVGEGTRLTLDASQRWREDARGGDQQTVRVTIEQQIATGVRIGGGAAVFDAGGATELRPHQQITFAKGRFEARTRLEQRFFEGADRTEWRLRQRFQYNQPLGDGWRASAGGEWLGLLQSRRDDQGASTEQWRAQVGVAYAIGDRLEIGVNYWLLAFPNGEQSARYSHVPQTVLLYRF